jgi:hypothetical protein
MPEAVSAHDNRNLLFRDLKSNGSAFMFEMSARKVGIKTE